MYAPCVFRIRPTSWLVTLLFLTAQLSVALQTNAATFDVVMETMMEAQGAEGQLIARLFGGDPTNPIQFTSNVNVAAGTFQFQTVPGALYLGQPLQVAVLASRIDQSDLWQIQSQGSLGTLSWNGNGAGIVGDIDDPEHGEIDWSWTVGGILLDYHVKWDWGPFLDLYLSMMKAEFTINHVVVATGEGADSLEESLWEWKLVGKNNYFFSVESAGSASFPEGGAGTFQMTIIPEPSTFALAAIGGLALSWIGRRRLTLRRA